MLKTSFHVFVSLLYSISLLERNLNNNALLGKDSDYAL